MTQKWPEALKYSPTKAKSFEELILIVTDVRSHFQSLPGAASYPIAFYDDKLIYDNQLLLQHYTKAPSIPEIQPEEAHGLHLAIAGHPNIYLEIPADIHAKYKANLEERILSLGKEIEVLEARLRNPNYVKKAPKELVDETKQQLATKQQLLDDMKAEFELV
jgi:valyl-tRNA synthetase